MLITEVQELAKKLQPRGGGKSMAAKIAGVALPTFSHAISGKAIVSRKTLKKIRDAIVVVLITEKMEEGFTKHEVMKIANIREETLYKNVEKLVS